MQAGFVINAFFKEFYFYAKESEHAKQENQALI